MFRVTQRTIGLLLASLLGGAGSLAAQNELFQITRASRTALIAGAVRTLAYSYDGSHLLIGGEGPQAYLIVSGERGAVDTTRIAARRVGGAAWSRDGRWLAFISSAGLQLRDDSTGALRTLGPASGSLRAVAFSPSGDEIAVADGRDLIRYARTTGEVLGRLRGGHTKPVSLVGYLGAGDALLSVGEDRRFIVWDPKTGTQLRRGEEPDPTVSAVALSLDGARLLLGTEETQLPGYRGGQGVNRVGLVYMDRLKIYDPLTGAVEKVMEHVIAAPTSISLSPDGKLLAVGQHDTRRDFVALWDVERGIEVSEQPADKPVTVVAWSPDGKWLAWGDATGAVTINAVTGVQPALAYTADLRGRKFVITSARDPLIAPSGRLRMAVLRLDPAGVDSGVALSVSDQILNRIAADPFVRLVERARLAAILGEQAFQHSGRTDPAYAVRIGRILNVQKLLVGSVARLGNAFTIDVQLVDVQSGRIDGAREIQCQNCGLEDLPRAVGELATALVSPNDAGRAPALPSPPEIEIVAPQDGSEVSAASVTLQGRVTYSKALAGVELIVNGRPYAASRLFETPDSTRLTPLGDGRTEFAFVQSLPLEPGNNVLAIRALGGDGNDDQRYVFVRRTILPPVRASRRPPPPPAGPPPLTLAEVETALSNHVPERRMAALAKDFGLAFAITPAVGTRLRAKGASEDLLQQLRQARRS